MRRALRILTAAIAAGGVGMASDAGAATYKIGFGGPLTGALAKPGNDGYNGARLAAQEWNAANPDHQMEVVPGDDQADPRQAVAVAHRLVNEGVLAVVGHGTSGTAIAASAVYHDNGVVQVTPSATNPEFTDRGLWNVFRVCGRDDQQGKVAADFVAKQGIKRVAILHDKQTYGRGLANAFRDALDKGHGIQPVYYGAINQGEWDFAAVLVAIRSTNAELVYVGGSFADGGRLLRQARELGLKSRFMGGDGMFDLELVKIAGKEATEGTWATFFPDASTLPAAKGVIDAYEKRFGPAGPYSVYAYAAAKMLFESIKAVDAKSAKDGRKLAEYIRQTTWDTALGRLRYEAKGDLVEAPFVVFELRNGEFVQVTRLGQQASKQAASAAPRR
jgi:branched-chain amino acid transport system substrate-binding protein